MDAKMIFWLLTADVLMILGIALTGWAIVCRFCGWMQSPN
jgi:hypothetical protein